MTQASHILQCHLVQSCLCSGLPAEGGFAQCNGPPANVLLCICRECGRMISTLCSCQPHWMPANMPASFPAPKLALFRYMLLHPNWGLRRLRLYWILCATVPLCALFSSAHSCLVTPKDFIGIKSCLVPCSQPVTLFPSSLLASG